MLVQRAGIHLIIVLSLPSLLFLFWCSPRGLRRRYRETRLLRARRRGGRRGVVSLAPAANRIGGRHGDMWDRAHRGCLPQPRDTAPRSNNVVWGNPAHGPPGGAIVALIHTVHARTHYAGAHSHTSTHKHDRLTNQISTRFSKRNCTTLVYNRWVFSKTGYDWITESSSITNH